MSDARYPPRIVTCRCGAVHYDTDAHFCPASRPALPESEAPAHGELGDPLTPELVAAWYEQIAPRASSPPESDETLNIARIKQIANALDQVADAGLFRRTAEANQGMRRDAAFLRELAARLASSSQGEPTTDTERLDWMQEHGASVDVQDSETLPITVRSSNDYLLESHLADYDIPAAIDAARAAVPPQGEPSQ